MTGEPASETPFRLHDPEAVLVRISGAVGDLVEAAERVVLGLPGLIALLAVCVVLLLGPTRRIALRVTRPVLAR